MEIKSLLYNSVTVSLPKNVVQFSLGVVIFWLVFGSVDFWAASIALASFLLAYSSVYFFNDITDSEEDRSDSDKRGWKLVANGRLSKRAAGIVGLAFLASGFLLSGFTNGWFILLLGLLIFLNILHSSPYIRLKKRMPAAAVNLTAIEFLKYSSGWFALTSNLAAFPIWLILTFSLIYSAIYLVYKFRFRGNKIISNKSVIIPLGAATAFCYIVSIVLYGYALPMILLLVMSLALARFSVGKRLKFMNWLLVEFAVLPMIVIAFLMLSIPAFASFNSNITGRIDQYKENIYEELPDLTHSLMNLSEYRYEDLEELQDAVNQTLNLSGITFFNPGKNK
ncbi:MAG: UbiA family prenyltransferase [Candidatus Aenigmarchaeota archaeon]|nr:UbiA family prenyltransferase [Candidatus Aenigmarchaeota archaeon]